MNRRKFIQSASGLLLPAAFASARAQGMLLNPYRFAAGGGGGPTLLINQGFETPTTGYDNGPESWTTSGTTITPTYTPALVGTQSCRLDGLNIRLNSPTFAAQNELWVKFTLNIHTISAGTVTLFRLIGPASGLGMDRVSGGGLRMSGSVNGSTTTNTTSLDTQYWVRIHYIKGTGANAFFSVEFNTTDSFSGSGNGYGPNTTNGTETEQITQIRFTAETGATVTYSVDNIQVCGGSTPMA